MPKHHRLLRRNKKNSINDNPNYLSRINKWASCNPAKYEIQSFSSTAYSEEEEETYNYPPESCHDNEKPCSVVKIRNWVSRGSGKYDIDTQSSSEFSENWEDFPLRLPTKTKRNNSKICLKNFKTYKNFEEEENINCKNIMKKYISSKPPCSPSQLSINRGKHSIEVQKDRIFGAKSHHRNSKKKSKMNSDSTSGNNEARGASCSKAVAQCGQANCTTCCPAPCSKPLRCVCKPPCPKSQNCMPSCNYEDDCCSSSSADCVKDQITYEEYPGVTVKDLKCVGWNYYCGKLYKEFQFTCFENVSRFVNRALVFALDHEIYPFWRHKNKGVKVILPGSKDRLARKDVNFAWEIEKLYCRHLQRKKCQKK